MTRVEVNFPGRHNIVLHKYTSDDIKNGSACLYEGIEHYSKQAVLGCTISGIRNFEFWVVVTNPYPLKYTAEDLVAAIQAQESKDIMQFFYASIALFKPQQPMTRQEYIDNVDKGIEIFKSAGFVNTSALFDNWKTMAYVPLLYKNDASLQILKADKLEQYCLAAERSGAWDPTVHSSYIDNWNNVFLKETT